jgi:hypothetical protein
MILRSAISSLLISLLAFNHSLLAQTGPAGVGNSTSNVLWLKADAGTNTTTNGANVSAWNDQSGNGINVSQTTTNQQPLYQSGSGTFLNNRPSILFDNVSTTNDYLTAPDSPLLDNTSGLSFFTVTRPLNLDNSTARSIISKRTSVSVEQSYMLFYWTGGNKIQVDVESNNDRFLSATTMNSNTDYMIDLIYDGALTAANRSKLYIGGTLDVTSTETSASVGNRNSPLLIGSTNISDPRPFGGHIAEVIQYRVAVNQAQRNIINNYLSAKYNISISNNLYNGDNTANGDYDSDVAGVGTESSGSNTQTAPSASAGLGIEQVSGFANGDYLLFGHRTTTNSLNFSDIAGISGTGVNSARWNRIWYLDITDVSTPIRTNFTFDFSDAGLSGAPTNTALSNYKLIYRSSTSGTWTAVQNASSVVGDQVVFSSVNLQPTGDGYYTIITLDNNLSPLPVTLIHFDAKLCDTKTCLTWSTATERDNAYFDIEKSNDAIHFESIKQVKTKAVFGHSQTLLAYDYEDEELCGNICYYRLKQVDRSGDFAYSPVVVLNTSGHDIAAFKLYPNPSRGELYLSFSKASSNGKLVFELFNTQGHLVLNQHLTLTDVNSQALKIDMEAKFQKGLYYARFTWDGQQELQKLIVE